MGAAGAGAGIGLVSGLIGQHQSSGDRNRANQMAEEAFRILTEMGAPPDLSQQIILKEFQQAGIYTPELESYLGDIASKESEIKEDASLRDTQRQALDLLKQTGATGMTNQTIAALEKARRDQARDLNAKLEQIAMQRQMQGLGQSGIAQVEQLLGAQQAANRAVEDQQMAAANASQAALQALSQAGSLGGQIRGQDFDVNQARARAADEMNRFNIGRQEAIGQRNVGARNEAQLTNLSNLQNISNRNIDQYNQELQRQNQAKRDYWNDQVRRAGMLSGAYQQEANRLQERAGQTAQNWANIGGGIGGLVGSFGSKKT